MGAGILTPSAVLPGGMAASQASPSLTLALAREWLSLVAVGGDRGQ